MRLLQLMKLDAFLILSNALFSQTDSLPQTIESKESMNYPTNSIEYLFQNDSVTKNNLESYGIEYVIINYDFQGDSTILLELNMTPFYKNRLIDEDRTFHQIDLGLEILVYSYRKSLALRSEEIDAE